MLDPGEIKVYALGQELATAKITFGLIKPGTIITLDTATGLTSIQPDQITVGVFVDQKEYHEVIHLAPRDGTGIMPCCERTPFEVSRSDRMTVDQGAVTCNGL